MKIYNTVNEIETDLLGIKDCQTKYKFLLNAYNVRRYILKKGLSVSELTDTETGEVELGLHLFGDDMIELSLKNDEVLRFIEIELEYIKSKNEHKTSFQVAYEQEVTEERKKKLQDQLAKLKTNKDKILFLKEEKARYLQNIPADIFNVSGTYYLPNFKPGEALFFDRYIQIEIDKLEGLKQTKSGSKKKGVLQAPAIKLFCSLIHQSTEFIKGSDEDAASYCKRVCEKFNLPYTDNVRKYFNPEADIKKTDKQLIKVKELILPIIDNETKQKIEAHINNNTKMFN